MTTAPTICAPWMGSAPTPAGTLRAQKWIRRRAQVQSSRANILVAGRTPLHHFEALVRVAPPAFPRILLRNLTAGIHGRFPPRFHQPLHAISAGVRPRLGAQVAGARTPTISRRVVRAPPFDLAAGRADLGIPPGDGASAAVGTVGAEVRGGIDGALVELLADGGGAGRTGGLGLGVAGPAEGVLAGDPVAGIGVVLGEEEGDLVTAGGSVGEPGGEGGFGAGGDNAGGGRERGGDWKGVDAGAGGDVVEGVGEGVAVAPSGGKGGGGDLARLVECQVHVSYGGEDGVLERGPSLLLADGIALAALGKIVVKFRAPFQGVPPLTDSGEREKLYPVGQVRSRSKPGLKLGHGVPQHANHFGLVLLRINAMLVSIHVPISISGTYFR